jgi:hypothetical protein
MNLTAISCGRLGQCMTVGQKGRAAVAEYWDGRSWSSVLSTALAFQGPMQGVSCPAANFCMTIGNLENKVLDWNGSRWSVDRRAPIGARDVSCASPSFCMTIGGGDNGFCDANTNDECEVWPAAAIRIRTLHVRRRCTPAGTVADGRRLHPLWQSAATSWKTERLRITSIRRWRSAPKLKPNPQTIRN